MTDAPWSVRTAHRGHGTGEAEYRACLWNFSRHAGALAELGLSCACSFCCLWLLTSGCLIDRLRHLSMRTVHRGLQLMCTKRSRRQNSGKTPHLISEQALSTRR